MPPKITYFLFFLFLIYPSLIIAHDESTDIDTFDPPFFGIMHIGSNIAIKPTDDDSTPLKNRASFIKPQSLLIISAQHKELPLYFVETDTVKGWIKKDSVFIVTKKTFEEIINMEKVLLIKPITINNIKYPIATALPVLSEEKKFYNIVIYENGELKSYKLDKKLFTKPVKANIKNFRRFSYLFLKKPYIWANDEKGWDCSGLVQDFYSFFNIKLPRNSYDQINYLDPIDVSSLTRKEKEKMLLKSRPFYTLLYFPGHIMIYTGKKGKEFFSFQALNRIENKYYGRVGYFPLKKTGLLDRITHIGFLEPSKGTNLTSQWFQDKLDYVLQSKKKEDL